MKKDNFIMISYEILDHPQLSSTDKIVYGLLTSLSIQKGHAFPSNGKLAEILNCSKPTISRTLNKLEKLEYIRRDMTEGQRKIYVR